MNKLRKKMQELFSLIPIYVCAISFGFHVSSLEMIKNYSKMIPSANLEQSHFYILASVIFICPIISNLIFPFFEFERRTWIILISLVNVFTPIGLSKVNFIILLLTRMATGFFIGISTVVIPQFLNILSKGRPSVLVPMFQVFILIGVSFGQIATYSAINRTIVIFVLGLFSSLNVLAFFCSFFLKEPITTKFYLVEKKISDLLKFRNARKSLFLGILIGFTQQMTGVRGLIIYSNTILKDYKNPKLITMLIGFFSVIVTILSSFLINRVGRKPLLKLSTYLITIAHIAFFINKILPLSFVLFHFGYSIGIGPICWLAPNELFPWEYQKSASTLCSTANWLAAFLVVAFFEYFLLMIGTNLFIWFIFVQAVFLISITYLFEETKQKESDFQ